MFDRAAVGGRPGAEGRWPVFVCAVVCGECDVGGMCDAGGCEGGEDGVEVSGQDVSRGTGEKGREAKGERSFVCGVLGPPEGWIGLDWIGYKVHYSRS